MPLTKSQRRTLLRAKELRGKPFPIVGSMLKYWKNYVIVCAAVGAYAWWTWSVDMPGASFAALGFLAGFLARDVAWVRVTARMWPVNVEIADWAKVDQLLNEPAEK
jgi:hypothetical protein